MLDCLKFLLSLVAKFIAKLFTINVGFTSLGVVFAIVYILLPIILVIANSLKHQMVSDFTSDIYSSDKKRRSKKWVYFSLIVFLKF